jgi:hypothetical protein
MVVDPFCAGGEIFRGSLGDESVIEKEADLLRAPLYCVDMKAGMD